LSPSAAVGRIRYFETDEETVVPKAFPEAAPAAEPTGTEAQAAPIDEPAAPAEAETPPPAPEEQQEPRRRGQPHQPQQQQREQQQQRPQAQIAPAPPAAGAAPAPEPSRYLNLAFSLAGTRQAVPWQESLKPDEPDYQLRINIGGLLPDRIPDGRVMAAPPAPVAFPAFALPPAEQGHWLEVVTASRDFFVALDAKAWLFLPPSGASWVCNCDRRLAHTCKPEEREPFVSVSLVTPPKEGDADLRVGIYFKNNLLQSCRVSARIARSVTTAKPQSVVTDYTINGTLSSPDKLESKTLNILSTRIKGGDQGFIVNGDFEGLVEFSLAEGQLRAAGDLVRQRLRDIHMKEESSFIGGKKLISKLDQNNGKTKDAFIQDLRETAPLGAQLLTSLFTQAELRTKLTDEVLREPSTIQIARASTNFVFPWGMVYDIPLQPGEPGRFTVCKIVEEWQDGKGLPVEGLTACPHAATHTLNTLCPFGFWGFRHSIEQPPSVASTKALAVEIRVTNPPARLVVCVSNDLEREYTEPHLTAINSGLKFHVEPCDSKAALLDRLKTVDPGVVYLYCHGGYQALPGSAVPLPSLSVGNGEKLLPADVVAQFLAYPAATLFWELANPLIFINGCHTVEITTDVLVNFVDIFASFNSSGVIGTEVTVHQLLANEFGAEFLKHFATETAGEALRRTRNRLLSKGNLMGLAYSAYCLSGLRLADTASPAAANPGLAGTG
jgi:hypothetical protein